MGFDVGCCKGPSRWLCIRVFECLFEHTIGRESIYSSFLGNLLRFFQNIKVRMI